MVVLRNGGLVLDGAWSSLEIWIDGVFRVFTFVTPTLKILGEKEKKYYARRLASKLVSFILHHAQCTPSIF